MPSPSLPLSFFSSWSTVKSRLIPMKFQTIAISSNSSDPNAHKDRTRWPVSSASYLTSRPAALIWSLLQVKLLSCLTIRLLINPSRFWLTINYSSKSLTLAPTLLVKKMLLKILEPKQLESSILISSLGTYKSNFKRL